MKKRKRRSIAASSAASRRAWRTRKKMMQQWHEWQFDPRAKLIPIARPTIDRLPKVEWK